MIRDFLRYLSLELNRSQHTVLAYEADLRGFNDFIINSGAPKGDTGFFIPSRVTAADIRDWLVFLSESRLAASSIRRKLQSLRSYFRYLVKTGVVTHNPVAGIPLPKRRRALPQVATHADIEQTLEETPDTMQHLIVEMLYGCGLRRSELLAVNDTDINPYSGELKVLGKGNKHRIIPLPPQLLEHIGAWQSERDSLYPDLREPKPLLAGKNGRISISTLYRSVRKALQGTGAEKKSPHTLRHSFATQLLNGGADINSVKELLGHSSLGATQIYTHLALSELTAEWSKAHPRAKKQ